MWSIKSVTSPSYHLHPLSCNFWGTDTPLIIKHIFCCPHLTSHRKAHQIPPPSHLADLDDNFPNLLNIFSYLQATNGEVSMLLYSSSFPPFTSYVVY